MFLQMVSRITNSFTEHINEKLDIDEFNFQEFYMNYLLFCDDELTESERRNNVNVYLSKFSSYQESIDMIVSTYQYHKKFNREITLGIISIVCGCSMRVAKELYLTRCNDFNRNFGILSIVGCDKPTIGEIKKILPQFDYVDFNDKLEFVGKYINHNSN